jgi:AmmeMemoRadiSam system protein A
MEAMDGSLSPELRQILLKLARQAVERAASGQRGPDVDLEHLPESLSAVRATFVTLTQRGDLRGCIGALQATMPLAQDVVEHARAAATEDFRFYPVRPDEVAALEIEISVLSEPAPLTYTQPDELLTRLRPGVDGVILVSGLQRATFLPQVWEKVSQPAMFLDLLSEKAGLPRRAWHTGHPDILTHQVESFHESAAAGP